MTLANEISRLTERAKTAERERDEALAALEGATERLNEERQRAAEHAAEARELHQQRDKARAGCRRLREEMEREAAKAQALLTERYHQLCQMETVAEAIRADLWDGGGDPRGHSYYVRLLEVLHPIGPEDLPDLGRHWWMAP